MHRVRHLMLGVALLLWPAATVRAAEPTILRLFLLDGSALTSYGEFARVGDQVVVSVPAGGAADAPRLHVISLPAARIDWDRTDRYTASVRYQRYAAEHGEEDFQLLTNQVAGVLNDIALTTDRQRALQAAQEARRTLADWPRTHFGYRQADVREIVSVLDEAINGLSTSATSGTFQLSLVAAEAPIALEPVLGMPPAQEQLLQLFALGRAAERPADRVALLQSALAMLNDPASGITPVDAKVWRRFTEDQLRDEAIVDRQYTRLARRLTTAAARAAARAEVGDVERLLNGLDREDARLGRKRDDTVQSLRALLAAQLEATRSFRLRRDQWTVRRALYRDYERSVAGDMLQLVNAEPLLQAIRTLAGPEPDRLMALRSRLSGGAERLERRQAPEVLRTTHGLLVNAWRFAEKAADTRATAISTGNISTAWEASSAAAGALMMLSRAQQELRALLEPPRLQ